MRYEAVIGLEVHVHLKTRTKAFCGCLNEFGGSPNSQVCPVCLGFPGSLPVLNTLALEHAIKVGLALNCKIQNYTKFDRKNYFYPDLPKNYQISQYDLPVAKEGFLDISSEDKIKRIGITRVHLEEDAGKLIHEKEKSLVDFNRSGVPLLEIVTNPDISSPEEAYEYLVLLKRILEYLEVSDCDMEKGSLRCDANVSIRCLGEEELGTKTELKNMNSFKGVRDALEFEIKRQIDILESGGKVIQETRLWLIESSETACMRTKEEAKDYRYFPEPDLPPFLIADEQIKKIEMSIPELPSELYERLINEYGISSYEARILTESRSLADYAEKLMVLYPDKDKKTVVNWIIGPMLSEANNRKCLLYQLNVKQENILELIAHLERGDISGLVAKSVLSEMIDSGKSAHQIITEKNLLQISDSSTLNKAIEEVIEENSKSVNDYRSGKENALMFLVGQTMKKTKGKANPKIVGEILKRRLSDAK